jgi:hypothetical protein
MRIWFQWFGHATVENIRVSVFFSEVILIRLFAVKLLSGRLLTRTTKLWPTHLSCGNRGGDMITSPNKRQAEESTVHDKITIQVIQVTDAVKRALLEEGELAQARFWNLWCWTDHMHQSCSIHGQILSRDNFPKNFHLGIIQLR